LYEGLLDFELKQAAANDPVVFLAVGNEPALTLSQLEAMDNAVIKQLFDALKKKDKPDAGEADEAPEDAEEPEEDPADEDADEAAEDDTVAESDAGPEAELASTDDDLALSADHLARAQAWLEKAAVIAGLVKKPRGKKAAGGRRGHRGLGKSIPPTLRTLDCPRPILSGALGWHAQGRGHFLHAPATGGAHGAAHLAAPGLCSRAYRA
jgi:hypothetical protein